MAGPPYVTLAQHHSNIGLTSRVYKVSEWQSIIPRGVDLRHFLGSIHLSPVNLSSGRKRGERGRAYIYKAKMQYLA